MITNSILKLQNSECKLLLLMQSRANQVGIIDMNYRLYETEIGTSRKVIISKLKTLVYYGFINKVNLHKYKLNIN